MLPYIIELNNTIIKISIHNRGENMELYFGLAILVAVLAIMTIICCLRFKKKINQNKLETILSLSAFIFLMSIAFALCLGFFMR